MNKIQKIGQTVYCLNDHGVNNWFFVVESGMTEEGKKTLPSVLKKVATKMAAVDELYEANEWLLNRVELLLAGTPVKDMDECISYSKKALLKANGATQ
jgi:hypothetical protein